MGQKEAPLTSIALVFGGGGYAFGLLLGFCLIFHIRAPYYCRYPIKVASSLATGAWGNGLMEPAGRGADLIRGQMAVKLTNRSDEAMNTGDAVPFAGRSSAAVGKRIVEVAKDRRDYDTFTPMKVLKLAYIAHGWMLALYGRPLIRDSIQAWRWGPLMPELYDRIRQVGQPRPVDINALDGIVEELDEEEATLVEEIVEIYGKHSAAHLVKMTHHEGSPWWKTYRGGKGEGDEIMDDVIHEYYRELLQEMEHDAKACVA